MAEFTPISDEQIARANAEGEYAAKMAEGVPRLKTVRLRRGGYHENQQEFLQPFNQQHDPHNTTGKRLGFQQRYVVLGEVGATGHYLIFNLTTNVMMPGAYHIERFEEIPEDEL